MHWNDTLPYHRAMNSEAQAQGINNISTVAKHAWGAKGWSLFDRAIYKMFTMWLSKHIPRQYNTVILFHFVSVYYKISR